MQVQTTAYKERWNPDSVNYRTTPLMVEHSYTVKLVEGGCKLTVRNKEGQEKTWILANVKNEGALTSIRFFMNTITDDLAQQYFPKGKKK